MPPAFSTVLRKKGEDCESDGEERTESKGTGRGKSEELVALGGGVCRHTRRCCRICLFREVESRGAPSAAQAAPAVRAIPVGAVTAKKGDMNVYIVGLGAVTPVYTVTIKSRVDGQLMEVLFKEGQMVKKDDLLATIDPRPYQAQLLQAEGQLARDQALLKDSQIDLERYRVLWKQDSIPKQQLDTQEYLVRQYEGAVKMDQGLVDNARAQVVYTRITAPISGRVGLRLVDPGNIVHAATRTVSSSSPSYNPSQ